MKPITVTAWGDLESALWTRRHGTCRVCGVTAVGERYEPDAAPYPGFVPACAAHARTPGESYRAPLGARAYMYR